MAQEQVNEDTVTRCERAAEGSVVDMAHGARRTTILQNARGNLGRPTRLLAHIERALGTQAKLAIDRGTPAGTDLAVHNLGRLARRGQAAKDLRAHQEDLGPRALASLDQLSMIVVEPVILAALAH